MILEVLLFSLLFCVIWFFIFRIKLIKDKKKLLKEAIKKIRKQDKKFIYDGKEIDLKKEVDLAIKTPKISPPVPSKQIKKPVKKLKKK